MVMMQTEVFGFRRAGINHLKIPLKPTKSDAEITANTKSRT